MNNLGEITHTNLARGAVRDLRQKDNIHGRNVARACEASSESTIGVSGMPIVGTKQAATCSTTSAPWY